MRDIKEPKDIREAATASKDVRDAINAAKEAKKDCSRDCGPDYDPFCAHDPANSNIKPRTFGSQCALDNYNCDMGTSKHMELAHKNHNINYLY